MKYLLLLFSIAFFNSCTSHTKSEKTSPPWRDEFTDGHKGEGSLIENESDYPYYADYWERQFLGKPTPQLVIDRADAYYDSLGFHMRPPHRNKIRVEYRRGFFMGFMHPNGRPVRFGSIHRDGYIPKEEWTAEQLATYHGNIEGKKITSEDTSMINELFLGFGYSHVNVIGDWVVHFEHSGFKPDGAENVYWLNQIEDCTVILDKEQKDSRRIAVEGFLSPEGSYGHLGGYPHELYATSIIETNAQPGGGINSVRSAHSVDTP